jgi:AcrR family transcriptional regulator
MEKMCKGTRTKNSIIKGVKRLFNKKEKLPLLDEIAKELSLTKSRITNHFPKKKLLIFAIYQEFEKKLINFLNPTIH